MQAILLRLLIALLTFLINVGIVKMATLAIRQIPKVLKTEQKQAQESRLQPVSISPASIDNGRAISVCFSITDGYPDAALVVIENQSVKRDGTSLMLNGGLPG
jgi:hypothetical protein